MYKMQNKLLGFFIKNCYSFRNLHASRPRLRLFSEALINRSLIKVSGPESINFLQGLLTADVGQLENGQNVSFNKSLYSMILNSQGRVLYDVFLHRVNEIFKEDCSLLLECENNLAEDIVTYLKKYKLRKKLQFTIFNDLSVWVLMKDKKDAFHKDFTFELLNENQAVFSQPDPRLSWFVHRFLLPSHLTAPEVVDEASETAGAYRQLRYEHGVAEGPSDLPPSSMIPLEANLFFLNGVSFNKGCYVGQELTARTHHTGVIRKRIMPLYSKKHLDVDPSEGDFSIVASGNTRELGRLRAWKGTRGLALLRLQECLLNTGPLYLIRKKAAGEKDWNEAEALAEVTTGIPEWWPVQQDQVLKQLVAKLTAA